MKDSESDKKLGTNPDLAYGHHNRSKLGNFREKIGLESLDMKVRRCLRCERKFHSYGAQHRVCPVCRKYYKLSK